MWLWRRRRLSALLLLTPALASPCTVSAASQRDSACAPASAPVAEEGDTEEAEDEDLDTVRRGGAARAAWGALLAPADMCYSSSARQEAERQRRWRLLAAKNVKVLSKKGGD